MKEMRGLKHDAGSGQYGISVCTVSVVSLYENAPSTRPHCRKGTVGGIHRIAGIRNKDCAGRIYESVGGNFYEGRTREGNIGQYIRVLPFIVLVFAIVDASCIAGRSDVIPGSTAGTHWQHPGSIPIACYILCMLILYNQRNSGR